MKSFKQKLTTSRKFALSAIEKEKPDAKKLVSQYNEVADEVNKQFKPHKPPPKELPTVVDEQGLPIEQVKVQYKHEPN